MSEDVQWCTVQAVDTTTGTESARPTVTGPRASAGAPALPERHHSLDTGTWSTDGWPHQRDVHGSCTSCGATRWECHFPLGPHCTCATDPYNCPQGQALTQAILARKQAQGDMPNVRTA